MEHTKLKAFPDNFYGARLRQLIRLKVRMTKTEKVHQFGIILSAYQEKLLRRQQETLLLITTIATKKM